MTSPAMTIRQLPPTLVDRIAAGEVVERPAAVVKELVENAIDAGASRIEVALREGGLALIAVTDDGSGMSPAELALAVERHCTSKLPDDDLLGIKTLGFRGESLPSIGSVAPLTVTTQPRGPPAPPPLRVAAAVVGHSRRGVRRQRAGDRRPARGLPPRRPRRPADAQPGDIAGSVSLRQWPGRARQAAGRRGARRLPGFPRARPPSHGRALPGPPGARSRLQL